MSVRLASEPRCTACKATLDAASGIEPGDTLPEPGDWSICFYCAEVAVYDGDPLTVRPCTPDEFAAFRSDPKLRHVHDGLRAHLGRDRPQ